MKSNTWNIEEYLKHAGSLEAKISNDNREVTLTIYRYKTKVMEQQKVFKFIDHPDSFYSNPLWGLIENYLHEITSEFYCSKIMNWIKANI